VFQRLQLDCEACADSKHVSPSPMTSIQASQAPYKFRTALNVPESSEAVKKSSSGNGVDPSGMDARMAAAVCM
jgi:hypothetical protein